MDFSVAVVERCLRLSRATRSICSVIVASGQRRRFCGYQVGAEVAGAPGLPGGKKAAQFLQLPLQVATGVVRFEDSDPFSRVIEASGEDRGAGPAGDMPGTGLPAGDPAAGPFGSQADEEMLLRLAACDDLIDDPLGGIGGSPGCQPGGREARPAAGSGTDCACPASWRPGPVPGRPAYRRRNPSSRYAGRRRSRTWRAAATPLRSASQRGATASRQAIARG